MPFPSIVTSGGSPDSPQSGGNKLNQMIEAANAGQLQGFKNRLINGGFDVWQRGTSGSGNVYLADRWLCGGSPTIARSTDVPTGARYAIDLTATGASLTQRIEAANAADLAAQPVVVSFWAKAVGTAGALSVVLSHPASTSDDFSSVTAIATVAVGTASTGWVRYEAAFTALASLVSRGLQVAITHAGGQWRATGIQLEVCGATTPQASALARRPYGLELGLCQRYYQLIGVGLNGRWLSASACWLGGVFPVPMRATPTAALTTTSMTFVEPGVGNRTTSSAAISASALAATGIRTLELSGFTGATAGNSLQVTSDVVALTAEL